MRVGTDFLSAAGGLYRRVNIAGLKWLLDRPMIDGCFINTKLNSITLKDYDDRDGMRGPGFTYGWIQGRGVEALATHADFFERTDPDLARQIDSAAIKSYAALARMQAKHGHVYFCYDRNLQPVFHAREEGIVAQTHPDDIYTYSDAFAAKGLIAGAARYTPDDLEKHLAYLERVIAGIEAGRFQLDEQCLLSEQALDAQADDFGPRMILLGAAPLLQRLGLGQHTGFADRFISHVLSKHLDEKTSLLRNVANMDHCNAGHGIEFAGFALAYLKPHIIPMLAEQLERILISSFRAGFIGPGIALSISVKSGLTLNPYCPWWPLPETIRATALAYQHTGNQQVLEIWKQAHDAFFTLYWHKHPPIAYQTLTKQGPIDYVPATPDLDPLYHTGLSLLAAIHAAGTLGTKPQSSNFSTGPRNGVN